MSPDRREIALGVIIGPPSSAWALSGADTLTVNVEDDPDDIARSGESSNSTFHPVFSVYSTCGWNISILLALFQILNVIS